MKKAILCLLIFTMFVAATLSVLADELSYDKYLTIADVEKVSGLKGITQNIDGKTLTFSENKRLVLNVKFLGAKTYKLNKETKENVKKEITGVGEAAFIGPNVDQPYQLIFRKKDFCVRIYTYIDDKGPSKKVTTVLTMDQLISLAKIVASRI